MIHIYIGYDRKETIAFHVLAHSIIRRTREPVSITPIGNGTLPLDVWTRPRGELDSTDFSTARFMVPYLHNYRGWACFMDCDMLCLSDIGELFECADDRYAVMVRKHNHQPEYETKFLNQPQTRYYRKNWSSLMLLNTAHPACQSLTPSYVTRASGLELHGFEWCPEDAIGDIPQGWNVLLEHK
jgi:hypothetical protein